MTEELEARIELAAAMRVLNHTFVAHASDSATLKKLAGDLRDAVATISNGPRRDRLALMRAARHAAIEAAGGEEVAFVGESAESGFSDRAVAGIANPTSIEFDVDYETDEVVARFTLGRAFEGAPGRAHGGMVAAAFDDVTGWVIAHIQEPAFTGELTVRFVGPIPVDTELTVRARLESRERRKLFITGELTADGVVVATCKAIYITVDPTIFAGAGDSR